MFKMEFWDSVIDPKRAADKEKRRQNKIEWCKKNLNANERKNQKIH